MSSTGVDVRWLEKAHSLLPTQVLPGGRRARLGLMLDGPVRQGRYAHQHPAANRVSLTWAQAVARRNNPSYTLWACANRAGSVRLRSPRYARGSRARAVSAIA